MKKRYHWVIMAACCLLTACSIGICLNCIGIFYTPVSEALGVGKGTFALHTTLSTIVVGFCSPLLVKLFSRYKAKLLISAGVILTVLSTALMGISTNMVSFFVLGALRGVGSSLFNLTAITIIIGNWFEKKHGLVIGIVFSFSGLGGALFNAVFSQLIESQGWQITYFVMAAVILVLALPAGLLICYRPEQMGLLPYGRKEASPDERERVVIEPKPVSMRSMLFILVCVFAVLATFITGMGQHLPGYAENRGLGLPFGATMLSFAMVGNIVFKLAIGVLSDKFGPVASCSVMLSVNAVALVIMSFAGAGSPAVLYLAAALMFGTIYSIGAVGISLVTRYVFGVERYASIYGYISLIVSIGGAVSLSLLGFVYDIFNTYTIATVGCMVFGIICLVLLQFIRIQKKREKQAEEQPVSAQ